jgi:protein-disulfide isomerase
MNRKICLRPGLGRLLLLPALLFALVASTANAQTTQAVPATALQAILASPLPTPASGAAQPDVTVVDYFDYNCPTCRELEPELRKLLTHDPKVRLVHKDWPIFGEASEYAAYCSFAAAREGKYDLAHDALITSRVDLDSKEQVRSVLRTAGFDLKKLDADIALHQKEYSDVLKRNQRETAGLGLHGTPGVIVGNQVVLGNIDYARLEGLVAQARAGH